jgi:hypothetical protein
MTVVFPTTKQNGKKVLIVQDKKARTLAEDILFALEELKQLLMEK